MKLICNTLLCFGLLQSHNYGDHLQQLHFTNYSLKQTAYNDKKVVISDVLLKQSSIACLLGRMTICCTHVIIPNDFIFNNCRKFSLKPQQFALVYLNLHNSPMRQHNTLGIFFQFLTSSDFDPFDVLTLINIVKRRCSKNIMEKTTKEQL